MTKADQVLLVLLCSLIGLLFQRFWMAPSPASEVVVTSVSGSVMHDISQSDRFTVSGPQGESTLEIADGAVRFLSSPCRHQVCVRSGWHRRSGAVAACVPNRISILLRGGDSDLDGLSY